LIEDWQQQHRQALTDPHQLAAHFDLNGADLTLVGTRYPMRITTHSLKLISHGGDPIAQQFIPSLRELTADSAMYSDPLNEEALSPVPHLVHRIRTGSCCWLPVVVLVIVGSVRVSVKLAVRIWRYLWGM
jgi:lysine 2,3-aminomutase